MTTKIHSRAPTRIDLAGGTVDIWPIYLFLKNPTTINLGIDLYAETTLEDHSDGLIVLRSGDQGAELKFSWSEMDGITPPASLELHYKFLRHFLALKKKAGTFDAKNGLTFSTTAKSPAGAGLGGSSTLSISMIGALATWALGKFDTALEGEKMIELARDVETTVIQVPAGLQDYYGAMFGGLQSLQWRAGAHARKWLNPDILDGLEKRLLLFYSGQSRNSGINNWALFKSFIDKQGPVRDQFSSIATATEKLEAALIEQDWNSVGAAIHEEWSVRKNLAPGISTADMNKAFDLAHEAGATAGKICGAGGGGCFFVYVPSTDSHVKAEIQAKITALGIRSLPFHASKSGLEVTVHRG